MVPAVRLQEIMLGKDTDAALASCKEHNYDESWAIMDGVLVIYDPADPPEWMKQAVATRDEDGNSPGFSEKFPLAELGWRGWSVGERNIHVGPLPGRKSIALYRIDGSTRDVLAYFRDENAARRFLADMDALLDGAA